MKNSKGFTLIELLVVIAIIGILASIVLASLNTARNKGADAAAKSGMGQLRAQAEMYYDNHGTSYDGVCDDSTLTTIMTNVAQNASAVNCDDEAAAWAASVTLKTGGTWCVDSTGKSASTTKTGEATVCNN